ncbi:MAG: T9SS type A sorting domain-containing protein [Chlorobi bacterium]|nr:T9SS type A sorting domain-containing protein [Chlorobiota bacterium]
MYSFGKRLFPFLVVWVGLAFMNHTLAQTTDFDRYFPDITITKSNDPAPGYFFLATKKTYVDTAENYVAIIDNYGTPVYFRLADGKAAGMQVREDGIYFNEGQPKKYYHIDSMLIKTDTFNTEGYKLDGHDFDIDSNRHVLLLGTNLVTMDLTSLGGLADATVKDKVVQEFDENGNLLFTWKALDHFEITDANENSPFVDFTASTVDYLHANSLTFDSDTSFLLSCRHFDEVTKIDRRTGVIIWRLGGKHNQFTFVNDTLKFSHPHTIRKLDNGNILIFDNGNFHNPPISSVMEYKLDEQAMTATLVRRQYHDPEIFANHAGGEMMLANGNLLVYWGEETPSFTEYHPDGSVAIEMDYSAHSFSNRVAKSSWSHKVFEPITDNVNFGMWDGYTESNYLLTVHNNTDSIFTLTGYATHTDNFYIRDTFPVEIPAHGDKDITVTFFPENAKTGFITDILTLQADYPHIYIASQVKLTGNKEDTQTPVVTIQPDTVNVPLTAVIQVDFTEPVRLTNGTDLNYQNIDSLFIFNKGGINGEAVPYNANINTDKTHIEIIPADSLLANQTYYVSLDAVLEDYSGNSIAPTSVQFSTGTSITAVDLLGTHPCRVFPNPGTGIFTFIFDNNIPKMMIIYDISGKEVYREKDITSPVYHLNLTKQKPGMYFFLIQSKGHDMLDSGKIVLKRE